MRVLRSSIWQRMDMPPLTTVVRECDLKTTLEDARQQLFDKRGEGFCVFEISELADNIQVEAATLLLVEKMDIHAEQNMAVLYFYTVNTVLPMLHDGGVFMTPDPSPLTAEQIKWTLEQVALHKDYRSQTVTTRTPEGTRVTLTKEGARIGG